MRRQMSEDTKDRRSLVDGLPTSMSVDRSVEEQVVFAAKTNGNEPMRHQTPPMACETMAGRKQAGNPVNRLPLTTRVRSDFAVALKRASLQRQLNRVFPNTVQEIVEDALESWLRSNGYLN